MACGLSPPAGQPGGQGGVGGMGALGFRKPRLNHVQTPNLYTKPQIHRPIHLHPPIPPPTLCSALRLASLASSARLVAHSSAVRGALGSNWARGASWVRAGQGGGGSH